MNSLLDEIRAEVIPNGPKCMVGPLLDSLEPDIRAAVFAAHEQQIHMTATARWLAKRKVTVKAEALRRHLAGACSCQKT